MKKAQVSFMTKNGVSSKRHTYITVLEDLIIGNAVIVETGDFYGVAVFMGYLEDHEAEFECKWIVDKLTFSDIERIKKEENKK